MVSRIRAIEGERCKFAYEMIRSSPHLDVRLVRHCNKSVEGLCLVSGEGICDVSLSVGRKLDGVHRFLEVMVMQYHAPSNVDE